tara:strand:- start:260 stop:682 length:423 start_codon:yes stop_codon:yes gene_type:complete
MENQTVQSGEGEVKVTITSDMKGKLPFKELGLKNENIKVKGGFLRLVFEFGQFSENNFYSVPTVELAYDKNVSETHWQCDFNGETISDKMDNNGNSTVILLQRAKMIDQLHHHENTLIVHGEFPDNINIDLDNSFINLVK